MLSLSGAGGADQFKSGRKEAPGERNTINSGGFVMGVAEEVKEIMTHGDHHEFELAINDLIERSYEKDVEEFGLGAARLIKSQWSQMKPHLYLAYCMGAKAQAMPEGFVVVPKEPTPKMIDSTWDYDHKICEMSSNSRNEFVYKKMIAAAQEPAND